MYGHIFVIPSVVQVTVTMVLKKKKNLKSCSWSFELDFIIIVNDYIWNNLTFISSIHLFNWKPLSKSIINCSFVMLWIKNNLTWKQKMLWFLTKLSNEVDKIKLKKEYNDSSLKNSNYQLNLQFFCNFISFSRGKYFVLKLIYLLLT